MSSATRTVDPGLHIPPPPPQAQRIGVAPHCGRWWRPMTRSAVEEAMLAFTLGLACSWVLVELALWFGDR